MSCHLGSSTELALVLLTVFVPCGVRLHGVVGGGSGLGCLGLSAQLHWLWLRSVW